jgi:hypothetical protein
MGLVTKATCHLSLFQYLSYVGSKKASRWVSLIVACCDVTILRVSSDRK